MEEMTMEVSKDVVYRCVAGEHILIPVGKASLGKNGMYILSEVGGLVWKGLSDGKDPDQIIAQILDEYDVDEKTARKDTAALIDRLEKAGLLTK
jgi:hypothetical protein